MTPRSVPGFGDLADLVRLPAVASVPGDSLAGAALAAGDNPVPLRAAALPVAASCLYLSGMALNDYADRTVDAEERPHRPIPSGRVTPGQAAAVAHGLAAAGVAVASLAGRRPFRIAALLAAAVYAYDLKLKNTRYAPLSMAACRSLDVLLGASTGDLRRAVPAAAAIGAHTAWLSTVSRHEVEGADPAFARSAAVAAGAVAAGAAIAVVATARRRPFDALAMVGTYAGAQLTSAVAAVSDPSPVRLQQMVGSGVMAMVPLQASFLMAAGRRRTGSAIAAIWPAARALARRRAVT